MHRTLIIARMQPGAQDDVARIFAESDRTELPAVAGVTHRALYRLGDAYVHLLETSAPGGAAVQEARRHPEFTRVSERLSPFITPYLPDWRSPKDAVAECFYTWDTGTDR
ncbi:TcmI family type II polyketide cyclase [Streptomyces sulphureus]|uniref:TcmI family type II polyketide cyclase n=1 Tax=Streptomyces sulphureus TaxID=47758 RepID=UPI000370CC11|nr:TcmI family type II polyketide cyclase [Streptomyces sulphureus]